MFENIYNELNLKRGNWSTEEEVRKGWLKVLENNLGIDFHAERERNDASYNQIIIEFKNKGLFLGSIESFAFKEAVFDRLKKYILTKADNENIPVEDYVGIAIDGDHIAFAYMKNDKINHGPLMPLSISSVSMVSLACSASVRRLINSINLIEDFGQSSRIGINFMQNLSNILAEKINSPNNNKIKMLFEEWKTLFGQVAGLSKLQRISITKNVKFSVPINGENEIPALLFVIHSYNSLIIKLLAAEIIAAHGLTSYENHAAYACNLPDEKLIQQLETQIEKGELFSNAGIKGFVEEAIFSWYIDIYRENSKNEPLLKSIRELLVQISLYRTDNLNAARTNDVLKIFYQDLVPESLRKSLGEFYTPDWLVETLLDNCKVDNWSSIRTLDPTCGSGSFLVNIIRRKRQYAEKNNWPTEETLFHIVETVWGFDLNPLAVQTSRVNFLIAISDLLEKAGGFEIEMPILLADSVYSPAKNPKNGNDNDIVEYRIGSTHADLIVYIPSELAFNRLRLDYVFEVMGEIVEEGKEYSEVEETLILRNYISEEEAKIWRKPLKATYDKVLELHRSNWNGIWFRIVRNFFWSATAGEFDLIVGNPPWVRWSNLPPAYREKIKPTCESYSIFSETPHHGGNELDISGMITYTVADKWLKENGMLAFVLTQTHFQSPSSSGFRQFKIDEIFNLIPQEVEDLKELKPFPEAANKTALVIFIKKKNEEVQYPVPYKIWTPKPPNPRIIPPSLTKDEVLNKVEILTMEANPVDGEGTPWSIQPIGKFQKLKQIRGECQWVQGRKGITTDLNGVYFINIIDQNMSNKLVKIETRPEAGKNDIGPKSTFWIEPDLIYPLLKGSSDFSSFKVHPKNDLYVIIPNKGIVKDSYFEADHIINNKLTKTKRYFNSYKSLLEERSTYRTRMGDAPYFCIYNIGKYTFSPFKVVWAEQSGTFKSAVVTNKDVPIAGNRPYIPDHKVFFVDFQAPSPAYYLCGLLNANVVGEYLYSHIISIQVGNIFKHLNLPEFNINDALHIELASISETLHRDLKETDQIELRRRINELANEIIFK